MPAALHACHCNTAHHVNIRSCIVHSCRQVLCSCTCPARDSLVSIKQVNAYNSLRRVTIARGVGSCWGHAGVMLGSYWGHAGVMLGSCCWGHAAGVMLGACWGHAGVVSLQAAELLTDVNKLAAQARRFLTKTTTKAAPPRSPSVSSRPGTPPGGSAADSLTSPLLSPSRTSFEEEGMEAQSLTRSNSSALGRRNMAGPFGSAAAQGDNSNFFFSVFLSTSTLSVEHLPGASC